MKIENSFEVPATPESAWELLMDVPRVIPCMPGAELTEVVDDSSWKAKMIVKLGPMSFTFATDVKREALDEGSRRATLSARAREVRGRGGGQATIVSELTPLGDGRTKVDLVTDLTLSGAVAQYGRGMVADISSQLVSRFADCLKAELDEAPAEAAAAGAERAAPQAARPDAKPLAALPLLVSVLRQRATAFLDAHPALKERVGSAIETLRKGGR